MPERPNYHRVDRPAPRRPGSRPYNRVTWRRLRLRKLGATPWCEAEGCTRLARHVDHRNGDATDNRWENLRSLCIPCHSRKTVAQDGGFGRDPAVHDVPK